MKELSLHILDIVQNSIRAGASFIELAVEEDATTDRMVITIADNGCGMTQEQIRAVTDPFYTTRTTRKVGLGVPFFKMAAEQTGGGLAIESVVGKGTRLEAVFGLSSIDRMPLGDMSATVKLLIQMNPQLDFVYRRTHNGECNVLDTRDMRKVLGEVPLNDPDVLAWIADALEE